MNRHLTCQKSNFQSLFIHAVWLKKTNIEESTNEQPSTHFFFDWPLCHRVTPSHEESFHPVIYSYSLGPPLTFIPFFAVVVIPFGSDGSVPSFTTTAVEGEGPFSVTHTHSFHRLKPRILWREKKNATGRESLDTTVEGPSFLGSDCDEIWF